MFEKIALIIIVNLILYFKTLRYKFVSDDFSVFHNPPPFKNKWEKIWLNFTGSLKLKAKAIHFFWDKGLKMAVVETEEREHLLALLIHIAICVSMFFAFGANRISFVTALLYSVNPVNNQATIWPSGRGYALPILSIMLSMAIPLLSPALLYFCTWYTIGFHGVLGLIGTDKWYLLAMVPFLWLWHGRKFKKAINFKQSQESYAEDRRLNFGKAIVYIKTYGFYLTLCLIPFRITFYHNFLQSLSGCQKDKWQSPWDKFFFIGLLGMIGTTYLACFHWGPIAAALIAFWVTITPFGNIYRANQEIAERFTALPNVFLTYAFAQLIAPYPAIVAFFFAMYATRTHDTVKMYQDEYWITEIASKEDEKAWYAWHTRALKRWDTQSYKEAIILWVMARMRSPREFKLLLNLSTCLRLLKNDAEADAFLKLAQDNIVEGQEKESLSWIEQSKSGKFPIIT